MMSNTNDTKSCFGQYENWDNSWHCKGCVVKEECEEYAACKQEETNEQSQ